MSWPQGILDDTRAELATNRALATPDACDNLENQRRNQSMTIHLPDHLQRYVHDQVLAGRFRSEDEVILDALERHRQSEQQHAAPASRRGELSSQEVQQRLFEAGLISEIKPPITDLTPYQNRRAVPIQGEPISVTALRERR